MIRIAKIEDINSLITYRIQLMEECTNIGENYDWTKYAQALRKFYYEGILNGKFLAYFAVENDKIVGTSMMNFYNIMPAPNNLEGKMALLTDMYIIPEFRNKGYGMKLLTSIMEHTKQLGYKKVILNATDLGRKLYESYGFIDVKGEMKYKF